MLRLMKRRPPLRAPLGRRFLSNPFMRILHLFGDQRRIEVIVTLQEVEEETGEITVIARLEETAWSRRVLRLESKLSHMLLPGRNSCRSPCRIYGRICFCQSA